MKKLYTLTLLAISFLGFSQVTLPHYEGFDYAAAAALQTQTGWALVNSGDDIVVASGNLSFAGLAASTGNKIGFGGAGIDASKLITTQTTGTIYYSLLLNVSSMAGVTNTNGGYLAGFGQDAITFGGTLWTKRIDDSSYNIGLEVRTATTTFTSWLPTTYVTGQTLFIVVAYTFHLAGGPIDDTTSIWINPTPGAVEPAATITDTHAGTDLASINRFFLRQDSVTETPVLEIDELRIGTTWADVTPAAVLSVNDNSIAGLKMYPNPVSGNNLYISSDTNSVKNVTIYDIVGKQVLNTKISSEAINVSNLNSGVYVVKITEDGKTATRKLVIK